MKMKSPASAIVKIYRF